MEVLLALNDVNHLLAFQANNTITSYGRRGMISSVQWNDSDHCVWMRKDGHGGDATFDNDIESFLV